MVERIFGLRNVVLGTFRAGAEGEGPDRIPH